MKRAVILACAMVAAFGGLVLACEGASDRSNGDGTDACNESECISACEDKGEQSGQCVDGMCICGAADAGGDTDSDADSDSDADGDTDTGPGTGSCDIDILMVLDTSGSMFDAAKNLREVAFPSFIGQLTNYPKVSTFRLGVVRHMYGENPAGSMGNVNDSLLITQGYDPGYQCQNLVDGCDAEGHEYEDLGGGLAYYLCDDVPEMQHQVDCNFASGKSWMEGPSDTFEDEFLCVGSFACHQYADLNERPIRAAVEALKAPENAEFLRPEALLVVILLTDENDKSTGMTNQEVHDAILALKGGDEKYVVVLSLAGPQKGTVEINPITQEKGCVSDDYGKLAECPKIVQFTKLFGTRGLHLDLCKDDLSTALTKTIDQLQLSCDEVVVE
ncbi:MAG: hypothetical protein PHU25_21690 [Deltaproteobacteria bacterium]|nr:hypothetical protein [Deltaproteobacteria bacterium]